jgi:hypothetical protein
VNFYAYAANNPARWIDPLGYDYITYAPSTKTLQWHLDDNSVLLAVDNVVTGPFDNGAIPHRHYKGWELVPTTTTVDLGTVCRGQDAGWKLRLDPQFDTRDAQFPNGRDRLLLHPDGRKIGTQGCIGVPCGLAADAVKMLLDTYLAATHSVIDVYVGDGGGGAVP